MKVGPLVKSAAVLYAAGGALSTGYYLHKTGSPFVALKGAPGMALRVFATWPMWLVRYKAEQKAAAK